ncbi:MAG TPA: glycosyltransferase [Acetobacteraceae bacterium]|nr:glycosyltransferase [Acetobacteraceae bacterium]
MKVLVWQWGRRGGGPRFAACLAQALSELPDTEAALALSAGAEILCAPDAPRCDLALPLYRSVPGLAWRATQAPSFVPATARWVRRLAPALALCAMPGPPDLLMLAALRRARVPVAVVVHDAEAHPGDGYPLLFPLNRALVRRAEGVIALSEHVAALLRGQGVLRPGVTLVRAGHPPFDFGVAKPPGRHGGPRRVLSFGRLLPYKGLDLLAEALRQLGSRPDMTVRVVGQGPEGPALAALRALPGVTVENRWVPEADMGALIGWADLVVLPYREASQSGIAAAALAAGRPVLATRVGGLAEQLGGEALARLCDPDPASIAAGLRHFLSSPPPPGTGPDAAGAWRDFARVVLDGLRPLLSPPERG